MTNIFHYSEPAHENILKAAWMDKFSGSMPLIAGCLCGIVLMFDNIAIIGELRMLESSRSRIKPAGDFFRRGQRAKVIIKNC